MLSRNKALLPFEKQPNGKTILLVDDDRSVRDSVGEVLRQEGYTVIPLGSGRAVLDITSSGHVNLALLDLNLPNENGWEVFQQLSNHHPEVPIIIVTARPNQKFTALAAGVGGLLEKPYNFPVLLELIEKLLAEGGKHTAARLNGAAQNLVTNIA
jgi:DNA-binding response OmpR family regulator